MRYITQEDEVNQNLGIGVDIEEMERFRKLHRVDDRRFLERVFTERELDYCFSRKDPAPYLAARFCAKEAVVKALAGVEIHKMSYRNIEIMKNAKGVPQVCLRSARKMPKVVVSLSHTTNYAIAFALTYYV